MAPLAPLFRTVYGRGHFAPEFLERKYAYAVAGVGGFSCTAFAPDGEPAATVAVLPFPIRLGNRLELAGQLVDAATAVAHQRRGLFMHLVGLAHELSEEAGISFMFAFPHPQGDSYPVFVRKLDYRHIDDLIEHRLPVRTVWAERLAGRVSVARPAYERYVSGTLSRIASPEPLPNSLGVEGAACVDRDHAFMAYKTSFSGSRTIELTGGRAWLRVGHGLLIGDLEASSPDAAAASIEDATSLARRVGAHQVLFQASRESRFTPIFAGLCESRPGLAVVYRDLGSQIPPEKLRFTSGDLDNF